MGGQIQEIFRDLGVKIEKKGRQFMALCPFHNDTNPSLSMDMEKGLWHCFGCGAGGNLVQFAARIRQSSNTEACEYLKKRFGFGDNPNHRRPPYPLPLNAKEIMNNVMNHYHRTFLNSHFGKAYLEKRGIFESQIFARFKIGYADGSLMKMVEKNRELKFTMRKIGFLNPKMKEFFEGYVVFPVTDMAGNCVEMYGRKVMGYVRKFNHLYLKGKHKGVFNWQALGEYREIILTEGIIDCLSLYQAGCKNTIPLYGTNGWTDDHRELFKAHKPKKIYFAFDPDEGGEKAVQELSEVFYQDHISCFKIKFPENFDANDYIRHFGADKFKELVQNAEPVKVQTASGNVALTNGMCEFAFEDRIYQVRDLNREESHRMRVNIRAVLVDDSVKSDDSRRMTDDRKKTLSSVNGHPSSRFHIDTIDLYVARSRVKFINASARMFGLEPGKVEPEVCEIIEKLEKMRVNHRYNPAEREEAYEMTELEKEEAISFLRSPDILEQVVKHFDICGYVGEEINKKIGYLITISRKLENPLSGVIISASCAGKSKLMEHLAVFVPEEDVVWYTRITPQALYYKEERSLKHKLMIACEEEGLSSANYSIRELISSKKLRMAAPIKDPVTGRMKTEEYEVEGPISLLFSTTSADIGYENSTRCFILSLDESRAQTRKVQASQRETRTLEGFKLTQESEKIRTLHKNAQRMLRHLVIINPYARDLTFPDHRLRTRRDQEKYLSLIEAIALLHQYQREVKPLDYHGQDIEYIEVSKEDIEIANGLISDIIGQNLEELRRPSRMLLRLIWKMIQDKSETHTISPADLKFNRRDIREYTGWSDDQIKKNIKQLEELEYLIVVSGQRGKMYKYELAYPVQEDEGIKASGLTDIKKLVHKCGTSAEGF